MKKTRLTRIRLTTWQAMRARLPKERGESGADYIRRFISQTQKKKKPQEGKT